MLLIPEASELPRLDADVARAYVAEWQEILHLRDWDVRVVIKRHNQLGDDLGRVWISNSKRDAVIDLLHPDDYAGRELVCANPVVFDWELTLVHELLHIHFCDILSGDWDCEKSLEHRAAERMIDALANALIGLRRRERVQS